MKKYLLIAFITIFTIIMTGCSVPDKPEAVSDTVENDYAGGLFDRTRIHSIDIEIAADDWKDLLENPKDKNKYHCNITIDGEEVKDVSCSAKGNSSLIMVSEKYDVERYSLKINFDKFVEGQRFHGIKKLNLNNGFADSTYMKDYLSYTMFSKAGLDAPLCSFSWVRVNGEDYGLFINVEEIDKNFLNRTGWQDAILYKPDSEKLAAGNSELDQIIVDGIQVVDYSEGAELSYRGEAIENYPDIFNNNETKAEEEDNMRVIRALKGLDDGKNPEDYLYTQQLLSYFAIQNFVMNYDGYTGPMLHNYYLCESKGKLAMFPWDYNLAFATAWARHNRNENDSTLLVNYGIDTPLFGTTAEQRPMWKWIIDSDEYREGYHKAMDEFLKTYFESGEFAKEMDETIEMLEPYVKKDPTSFEGFERFSSSSKALKTFCELRAASIRKQLDNKLSAETSKQIEQDRIDASAITIDQLE